MYYYLIIILGIVKCDAGKYNITRISSYDVNSKWNKYSGRFFPLEKNVTEIVPSEHFLFTICVTVDSLSIFHLIPIFVEFVVAGKSLMTNFP